MKPFRQISGILIIALFAIPTLFGIIWAVGITRAVVSPDLLSDLPQEVIREIPYFIEDVYKSAQKEDAISDLNSRIWIRATEKAGISPKVLMREIGFLDWMEKELSHTLQAIGETLRGEIRLKPIILDLRSLKEAFNHEAVERDFIKILNNLPACDSEQKQIWKNTLDEEYTSDPMPACNPDIELAQQALKNLRNKIREDIPDEVDIFEDTPFLPDGISISKTVISLTYLLFLIPAVLILLGSLVGSSSKSGFFRWCGISTIIGGGLALLLSLFARNISSLFVHGFPYKYTREISFELQEVIFENLGNIFGVIFHKLFSPVVAVAGAVCIVGVIFFAFSFAFHNEPAQGEYAEKKNVDDLKLK